MILTHINPIFPWYIHIFPISSPVALPICPRDAKKSQARCRVKQKMADLDRSSVVVYGRSHGIIGESMGNHR